MSLAQRFERRLESLVGSAFARVFKGQVEPVEIGTALQREAADKRNVMADGKLMCPNRYRVTLGASDYERLAPWEAQLTGSLAELVQEHLDENGWTTIGDVEVLLARDDSLHTGVFGVASRMEPQAPPRRRPFDSLSLPIAGERESVVPGITPAPPVPPVYEQPQHEQPQHEQPYYGQPQLGQPQFGQPQFGQPQFGQPAGGAAAGAGFGPPVYEQPAYSGAGYPPDQYGGPDQYRQPDAFQQPEPNGGGKQYRTGAPTRPAPVALVVDGTSKRLDLRVGANLVGRGTEADLQLLDQGVSRRHVEVDFDGVHAICFDLGSTNGTSVNGHELGQQAVTLQHGDVIRVGHTRLVFAQEER